MPELSSRPGRSTEVKDRVGRNPSDKEQEFLEKNEKLFGGYDKSEDRSLLLDEDQREKTKPESLKEAYAELGGMSEAEFDSKLRNEKLARELDEKEQRERNEKLFAKSPMGQVFKAAEDEKRNESYDAKEDRSLMLDDKDDSPATSSKRMTMDEIRAKQREDMRKYAQENSGNEKDKDSEGFDR